MQLTLGEMLYRFRMERDVEAQQVCWGLCTTGMMVFLIFHLSQIGNL